MQIFSTTAQKITPAHFFTPARFVNSMNLRLPCCMRQQRWGEQNWRDAQKPDQACGYRHCSPIILWELLESFSLKRRGIVTGTFASWLVTRQLLRWAIMKSKRLKCWNSHLLYNNVNTQRRSCLSSWKYGSRVPNLASLVALWADSSPLVMPDLALVTRIFNYSTPSAHSDLPLPKKFGLF